MKIELHKIISRQEAIANGLKRYFTGKPCKHGHISERIVYKCECVDCIKVYQNSHKRVRYREKYFRNHRKENRGLYRAKRRKEKLLKIQRMPKWADEKEIEKIYRQCASISESTGEKYHVDHSIPLRGKNVSGLHVHYNLQIITAAENLSKGNKLFDG